MLEQGPNEQKIIEQCVRQRKPLPQSIENAPELWLGNELFYCAFMDLNSERHVGFGEGPIPWSSVLHWCREYHIIGLQREDMHYHINKLDTAYLEHRAKQAKKSAPDNGPKIIRPQDAGNGPRRR